MRRTEFDGWLIIRNGAYIACRLYVLNAKVGWMVSSRCLSLVAFQLLAVPVAVGLGVLTSSVALSDKNAVSAPAFLSSDRATLWNPGMMAVGGIPQRSDICANVSPRGPGLDDTAQIQFAIAKCADGQVVQLSAGEFFINSGNFILINKGITLRGSGPSRTTLIKTDGARPFTEAVGPRPSPIAIVGPSQYSPSGNSYNVVATTDLARDAIKGETSIEVADAERFSAGDLVLLDEASGARWMPDPQGRGQIWAAEDWRVVWQKHNPMVQYVDDFGSEDFPTKPGSAGTWFSRPDRPTAEVKQIASISGNVVVFTTPIHISYRQSHAAQLSRYGRHVEYAGIEDLKLVGGDAGNLSFRWAAYSWAKNVENTVWHDEGFSISSSFRIELRQFYVHDAAWAQPGGGGYAISLSNGSSEVLIEDGISVRANKLMVARSAGAGSVVGYNYMDMGYINSIGGWIEVGLNASHMVGSHHVLFEGNYAQNADSDQTHGNSIYHTFFRNYLPGIRSPFENQAGGRIDDATEPRNAPKRCVGLMAYSYWMSFAGNVLGVPGKMGGWVYETKFADGSPGVWMLGWDSVAPYPTDVKVLATTVRHGNFDYLTNQVGWDPQIADRTLPNSLYLKGKPGFFKDSTWPWVDPIGSVKTYTLPAKARYDAGQPFLQH